MQGEQLVFSFCTKMWQFLDLIIEFSITTAFFPSFVLYKPSWASSACREPYFSASPHPLQVLESSMMLSSRTKRSIVRNSHISRKVTENGAVRQVSFNCFHISSIRMLQTIALLFPRYLARNQNQTRKFLVFLR